jgi:hypothetical protein
MGTSAPRVTDAAIHTSQFNRAAESEEWLVVDEMGDCRQPAGTGKNNEAEESAALRAVTKQQPS